MPLCAGIPDRDAVVTADDLGGDRDGSMTFALTPFCDQRQSHELKHLGGSTNTVVLRSGLKLRNSPEDRRSRRLLGFFRILPLSGYKRSKSAGPSIFSSKDDMSMASPKIDFTSEAIVVLVCEVAKDGLELGHLRSVVSHAQAGQGGRKSTSPRRQL